MIKAKDARDALEQRKAKFKEDTFNGLVLSGYKDLIEEAVTRAIDMGQCQCEVVFPRLLTDLEQESMRNLVANYGYMNNGFDEVAGWRGLGLLKPARTKMSIRF